MEDEDIANHEEVNEELNLYNESLDKYLELNYEYKMQMHYYQPLDNQIDIMYWF